MSEVNEYDAAYDRMQERQRLRQSMYGAVGVNPDQYAEAKRIGQTVDVPADIAARNLEEVKRKSKLNEYDRLLETSPLLAKKYAADPEFAKLAHDDAANLTAIEESFREAQRGGRAVRGKVDETFVRPGDLRTSGGQVGEVFRRSGRLIGEERGFVGGITEPVQRGLESTTRAFMLADIFPGLQRRPAGLSPLDPVSKSVMLADQQRRIERFPVPGKIAQGMQDISGAETFGEAFTAAVTNPRSILEVTLQSLGGSAPVMAAALTGSTLGPAGTAAGAGLGSFAVEYANTVQEVMSENGIDGKDPDSIRKALSDPELMAAARTKALKRGVAVGVFDALTAGLAGRLLAGAKPTVASVGSRVAGELGLQAGGGATGEAVAQAATGEYKPGDILLEALAEMPSAVVEVPANYRHAAQRAESKAVAAEQMVKLAEASKLRERDPEAFKAFIAEVAASGDGPAEFFIDGEVLANTLNQSAITMQELEAIAPTVARQLRDGVPGADIRVPTTEFVAAPAEIVTPLLDHLRESPDAMSRAEAQEYLKTEGDRIKQDVETVLGDEAARTARKTAADTASQVFEEQLTAAGRFRPEVNKAYATVLGNFYATQAERSGFTVEEFMDRYQLRVVGKESAKPLGKRQTLEQGGGLAALEGQDVAVVANGKPDPVKQREMIELRKQESVLKSLITCLGGA